MNISKKFQPYIGNVLENKDFFEKLLKEIESSDNYDTKQKIAKMAINFALANSCAHYSSSTIENVFLDIAQQNTIELSDEVKPNSFLHVMTQSYATGGHTRVVERWIESSDNNETHSLIFTGYINSLFIPEKLQNAVKDKNGEVIFINHEKSDIEKALELRKIASEYQTIILHIHMFDVLPLIAFGCNEFKRPVIFFNHADHVFWLGVSISDIVAEMKENSIDLSINRRQVKNSFLLKVPVDINIQKQISKTEARNKLNLPVDKKIILTIGAPYKYRPILDYNFIEIIKPILQDKNVFCLGIGPDRKTLHQWAKAEKIYEGQVTAIGTIPYEKVYDYIYACDLVIDGIPFGGATALIDTISCNRPILFINNFFGSFDCFIKSRACCKDSNELVQKAQEVLYDENLQQEVIDDVYEKVKQENSIEVWKNNLKNLLEELPKQHSIHRFQSKNQQQVEDRDIFAYLNNRNEKQRSLFFKIPFLLAVYKVKDLYSSRLILKLFNAKFKLRERII